MKKVLLLSAGTNACYHMAKTLREKFPGQFKIIGADINPVHLIPTAGYLDAFYRVPYTADPKYYDTVIQICRDEAVDFLIPSFDADQRLFTPENPDLIKMGTRSLGTSMKSMDIYESKAKMNAFLSANDFPVPVNYSPTTVNPDEQYMAKPVHGVGSIGAGVRLGREIANLNGADWVVQEVCQEPEVTMECFAAGDMFSCVCRERIATKSGVCVKGRLFNDDELTNIGRRFAKTVNVPYIFNMQFMKNSRGQYVITDVNLRTAGGMSMAHAAGWDEVSALGKIMLGRPMADVFQTLPQNIAETYVVRAYVDIVNTKSK